MKKKTTTGLYTTELSCELMILWKLIEAVNLCEAVLRIEYGWYNKKKTKQNPSTTTIFQWVICIDCAPTTYWWCAIYSWLHGWYIFFCTVTQTPCTRSNVNTWNTVKKKSFQLFNSRNFSWCLSFLTKFQIHSISKCIKRKEN